MKNKNIYGQSLFSVISVQVTLLTISHLFLVNIAQVSQLLWFEAKQGPPATDSR